MSTVTGSGIPTHSCSDFVVTREPGVTELAVAPVYIEDAMEGRQPLVSTGQGDYRRDFWDTRLPWWSDAAVGLVLGVLIGFGIGLYAAGLIP